VRPLTNVIRSNRYIDGLEDKLLAAKNLTSEHSVGEIFTETFRLYSQNFVQYLIPFLAAGIITGLVAVAVRSTIVIPAAPVHPTPQQLSAWFLTYLTAAAFSTFLSGIVGWIASGFTFGITIKFTSDMMQLGQANLRQSLDFTLQKLLSLLAASVITGILLVLGFVALIIPGVILAVMFSLVFPVIMLERTSVLGSLSRSSALVRERWLKTFGLLLLIGIIIAVVNGIFVWIVSPLGIWGPFVSSIIGAFITPISAIALTIYYYSMSARTLPPPPPPPADQIF
jgi:hypothetical protein